MKIKTEIKICGVRTAAFAREAERLGAAYLGLIFAAESPRAVTERAAGTIIASLSGRACPVAVFTDTPVVEIADVCRRLRVGAVQLHRRARSDEVSYLLKAGLKVWTLAGGAVGDAVIFDSSHGDGESKLVFGPYRTVLAGGISSANIGDALAKGADVIDVSGSLETTPGRKSVKKLREFFGIYKRRKYAEYSV